jgi:hypothetical protein
MRRAAVVALVLACAISPDRARAQAASQPSGGRIAAQVGTGVVLAPVGFLVGGLGARWVVGQLGASEEGARRAANVGAWATAAAVTSLSPPLLKRGGAWPHSVAGVALGGAAAGVLIWAGRARYRGADHCRVLCTTLGAAAIVLPAVGATILYNRSR